MSALIGFHGQGVATWSGAYPAYCTQNLAAPRTLPAPLGGVGADLGGPSLGAQALAVAASPRHVDPGIAFPSFLEDFYNRVHLSVRALDLGNLLSTQTRTVDVWNGYLEAGQTLGSLSGTGADGIAVDIPVGKAPPYTYKPLESVTITLQISNVGSPKIDAEYVFGFSTTLSLNILGNRAVIWKTRPNWKREVIERWQWLTDVLTAYDNSEQRIKLRSKPRREYEFQVLAWGRERQDLENALWGWQHRPFAVPVWQDQRMLAANAGVGATSLSLDTVFAEFEEGGLVVLADHQGRAEAQEILSVTSNALTLKNPLQGSWPKSSYVYPARLGRIGARQALTRLTGDVAELVVNFRFDDAGTLGAPDTYPAYRGLPVLEDAPNWAGSLEAEFVHKIAEFDYQTGPAFVEYEGAVPNRLQQFRWFLNGRADVDRYRRMLGALSGRLTPFWFPSQTSDFTVTQPIGANATQITVRNTGYAQYARQQNGRKDIRIQLRNGAIHYRRLTDAAILSDAEENLQIDSALGSAAIQPDDIRQVSFLSLVRLDQDQVEIAWRTAAFAESSHTVRTLHYDV